MSHGFFETRTVKMEPGPDGKLVPHVYIERRPLSEKEAFEILKEQNELFAGFDGLFSGMNGFWNSFDNVFKTMSKQVDEYLKKQNGQGNVER